MRPLQGLGVLVTRPEHQAAPLCRLLEEAGARVVRLPAIEIRTAGSADLAPEGTGRFDFVIFTSANAVRFGAALLNPEGGPAIAAIGPATARALGEAGHRVTVDPGGGFDSESLLRHPLLAQPAGRRILIVTGMQGRGVLQRELGRRRERAAHESGELARLQERFAAGEIQIITATSAEIAAALCESATPALRRHFDAVHWLVPGARVADAVRTLGISAPLVRADTAEDHDLVAAIVRWRASVSGA